MTRYAVDTNLYIRAFRDREAGQALERFLGAHAPRCHLSSVVLHELLVGATTPEREKAIEASIAESLVRRRRTVTPSHRCWQQAGEIVARLANDRKLDRSSVPRSFVHDVLIATSCAEQGITIVTDNQRDFDLIRSVFRFEFALPWPAA